MKKFLIKLFNFFAILIVPYILIQVIFGIISTNINYNISESNSIAIIGNSQPQCAINDEILSDKLNRKCTNYSDGGQSMFWTLVGAKKLKHQGIKHFIIEISSSTFKTGWKTTDKHRGLREIDKKYFLSFNDWKSLFQDDIIFSLKYFLKPSIPSTNVRGMFFRNKMKFKSVIVRENRKSNKLKNDFPDYDDTPLHVFIKENNDIEFIIIRVPKHPQYYKQEGLNYQEKFLKSKYNVFEKYSNCRVLDFGHLYSQDKYFADLGHMSSYGSDQFSLFLSNTLEK